MPVIVVLLIAIVVFFVYRQYLADGWLHSFVKVALLVAVVMLGVLLPLYLFNTRNPFLPFIAIACIASAALVYARFERRRAAA